MIVFPNQKIKIKKTSTGERHRLALDSIIVIYNVNKIKRTKHRQRHILDSSELPDTIKEHTDFKHFTHVIDHHS